ncbi:hypothetical protein [Desulfovibrio intestinalis]|uniref:Putative lipid-binding transport protein (Tim44 family) n=1 Tax=Desulfovibrio intestinalis TaxID=58621 RepID=A0A7W8C2N8_9BACT|nr:hypothetical protein [Desulfovibrio intestinalis]MBB5144226.1 putative lipid-binding transport protein (Tim44 family) [Desulfovibrio intestinalis]
MNDKKKIAIAILLSVIVFIVTLLGQMMLEQRAAQAPNATPPAQTEAVPAPADPAAPATPAPSPTQPDPAAPADLAPQAIPAQPEGAEQAQPDATTSGTTNKTVPAAQ